MWSWVSATDKLEKLDNPPVVEVICGVHFQPLDIDPVVVGGYWAVECRDRFPKRQLHPALPPARPVSG